MGSNIPLGLHAIPTRSTACPGCGRRRWAAGTSRFEAAWKYPDWLMNLLGLILPNSLGLIIFWIPYLMYVKHDDKPGKSINQLVFETWGLDHLPGYAATDPREVMVNPGCVLIGDIFCSSFSLVCKITHVVAGLVNIQKTEKKLWKITIL